MPPTSGHAPPETARSSATLAGEVLGVDGHSPETHMAQSVRLRLLTDSGEVQVELAPAWVLDEKGLNFVPKERVRVKGKKTVKAGEPIFEAQTIERDTKIHKLRRRDRQTALERSLRREDNTLPACTHLLGMYAREGARTWRQRPYLADRGRERRRRRSGEPRSSVASPNQPWGCLGMQQS